jgi:hypothetical protein
MITLENKIVVASRNFYSPNSEWAVLIKEEWKFTSRENLNPLAILTRGLDSKIRV